MRYRPEIDGIRAVAIFSVIIYHSKFYIYGHQFLTGGYLGVDIFFVISGYLITSIIFNELLVTNKFSFINFYQRRIRRILPVLFLVITLFLPISYLALLPNSLQDFTSSILFSIALSSNFYFYTYGQEYSAVSSLLTPFLHTWTLSVEEQFYILCPVFILIIFKFFKKHLLNILFITFSISLFMSDYGSKNYPVANFYFLHTRMWELLAGSLVAYLQYKNYNKIFNSDYDAFFANLGLFLILISLFLFNDSVRHPSAVTLVPILGSCLLLYFLKKKQFITKVLSSKIFVFFGLISYSLYLFHYPIFAFYRSYFGGYPAFGFLLDKILIVAILFILSTLSYLFIEKYFRNPQTSFKKVLFFILINFSIIVFFSVSSFNTDGFRGRIPKKLENKLSFINFYSPEYRSCFVKFEYRYQNYCKFGNYSRNIVFVGDSRAAFLLPDIKNKILDKKINLNILTLGKLQFKNISEKEKYMIDKIKKFSNSVIVINAVYNNPENMFDFLEQKNLFFNFFQIMKEKNNKIVFVQPIPIIKNPLGSSTGMRKVYLAGKKNIQEIKILKKEYINTLNNFNEFKVFIKSKSDNVFFLDLDSIFCDSTYCYSIRDGFHLLQDEFHQSGYSAKIINNLIIRKIDEIYKN